MLQVWACIKFEFGFVFVSAGIWICGWGWYGSLRISNGRSDYILIEIDLSE